MLLIAFKSNLKQQIFNFILLFIYTYAFGGFITNIFSNSYHSPYGIISTSKYSIELMCLSIIVITHLFDLVANHIKTKIKTSDLIYKLKLFNGKYHITINAYLDTGNFLNLHGKPVLILDLKIFLKLTKENLIQYHVKESQTLETSTVSGTKNLKVFTIDKLIISNKKSHSKIQSPLIAVNSTQCFKNTNYQALISPLFL